MLQLLVSFSSRHLENVSYNLQELCYTKNIGYNMQVRMYM